MDNTATYYETLIARYLSGEADADQIAELNAWISSEEENKQLFTSMRESWALNEALNVENNTDLDEEWSAFSSRTGISDEAVSRKLQPQSSRRFMRVAAILLILIVPSITYFLFFMNPGEDVLLAEDHIIESTLPDGTQITLNTGSSLHYPSKFKGKERKVSLEGEAYFDVAHNKKKAFVINAKEMQIRVLGTSFYVNTRADDKTMEVVLMSGSVQINYKDKEMLLEPGDKAVVLTSFGEIVKQENNNPNLLAWKTRKLQFNDTPLGEIVDILKKVYQKDILVLNPDVLNCRITATFNGQSLEAVLLVLQSTIDIKVKPNGKVIEISGEGCQ
ncbi:MAG: FecR domain-containing protein [Bacteroidota bacterium]